MSILGTFRYLVTVPEHTDKTSFTWPIQCQATVPGTRESNLVGYSPDLQITDAGLTSDIPALKQIRRELPKVLCSQFTLVATEMESAFVARASFYVDKGLTSCLQPGDIIHLGRSDSGGLGISVIREGSLVVAAGAVTTVPLGNDIDIRVPRELTYQAAEVFRKCDPKFEFRELPIEIRVGEERRLLLGGWPQLGPYKVYVAHGMPNDLESSECIGISRIGACGDTTASCTALLLDNPRAFKMVPW